MKKIFYEKIGRKYVPVAEYDSEWLDSFPKGTHLVQCQPGGQSRRFNIDPAYAPMIAAGRVAGDAISKAIMEASKLRPEQTPITTEQRKAWDQLAKAFGNDIYTLNGLSVHACTNAGVQSMMEEAEKLLQNEAVKKAYDHFILVCELSKNSVNNKISQG